MKKKPVVAIIGRPNVGKSTLFNRILKKRAAIVHGLPGVTRDRHYDEADWAGHEFILVDTGGYFAGSDNAIDQAVLKQIEEAISEAAVVVLVVDAQTGATALDTEIARLLRRNDKPVLLAANKIDDVRHEPERADFFRLGLGEAIPISAATGRAIGDFLDELVAKLPTHSRRAQSDKDEVDPATHLHLAIVGRPNVGKSSLVNAVLGHEKVIVNDIAGTTRDAIDTEFRYKNNSIVLIDTAGLRKTARVKEAIEFYSTLRTREAIRRCQVAVVMIDAQQSVSDQDLHIVAEVARFNKGVVIAVNKWDLIEKEPNAAEAFRKDIAEQLRIYDYAPVLFISAQTKQRVFKLMDLCLEIHAERGKEVRTTDLNEFLQEVMQKYSPPSMDQREVKIKYLTQVKVRPPVFAVFCNHPESVPRNYRQYLEKRFRRRFGFAGVPLTFNYRKK